MSYKLDWWITWLATSAVGSSVVAMISWWMFLRSHGYTVTFDLSFAAIFGGSLGLPLGIVGGLLNKGHQPTIIVQLVAFSFAAVTAVVGVLLSHIMIAIFPAAIVYLGTIAMISRRNACNLPGICHVCGYDLRGLPEARCPECGTRTDI